MNPRYLTKSRFKLAVECPTKLYYSCRPGEYRNIKQDDSFLQMLAEGGFQVGELAKTMYPGGIEIISKDHTEAETETLQLLARDEVILFEPAIRFGDWYIRVDILIKRGNTMEVIEVKAKSYDSANPKIVGKKGGILADMLPYIHDIAFQTLVAQKAFPAFQISSFLMMPDKSRTATIDGLNQYFKVQRTENSARVIVSPQLKSKGCGEHVLALINVDGPVSSAFKEGISFPGGHDSVEGFAQRMAEAYTADIRVAPSIGPQCGRCEFRTSPGEDLRSGFHECWKEANTWTDKDVAGGTVLDLWNFRGKDKLISKSILRLSQLTKDDINYKTDGDGLSVSQRQWMQIAGVPKVDDKGGYFLDTYLLRAETKGWVYPFHFIDFETAAVALPFYADMRPYEQIAFQFSHHMLGKSGKVEHAGEFLQSDAGKFPNYEFARELKAQLQGDTGSVFMWSHHENTILNRIVLQLQADKQPPEDADELIAFLRTLTKDGNRAMVDLKTVSEKTFFHPDTRGSSSLKVVLPAILKVSAYLRGKYSKPIYGATNGIRSLNFKDHIWWREDADGQLVDPYLLLKALATTLAGPEAENMERAEALGIAEGGAAAAAYSRLQFEDLAPEIRIPINAALLRYCELDTLAMAQVVEAWREWCES
ncbi:MAG: DUF2779 domain-containing protein [Betaproteobacteria bacterium]